MTTQTAQDFLAPEPEKKATDPEFDRWGRYRIPHPADPEGPGKSWTRASTVSKAISDQTALGNWKLRMALQGSQKMDLSTVDWSDNRLVDQLAQRALDAAGANEGATGGTKFHYLTECYDLGDPLPEHTELEAKMLQGYKDACVELGVFANPAFIEQTVAIPDIDCGGSAVGVAGTFDRVMQSKKTGKSFVWDFKSTSKLSNASYSMADWEIQLAIYAQATAFWSWEDKRYYDLPKIEQDFALVFHVERGTGEWAVYKVDLEAGRKALELACRVRAWRQGNQGMKITPITGSR